ncbi:hypothetical protein WMY93_022905 [Mugilogobius chulae]|uniref:Uncharacterized protein n=1 Tax=Mugilogobius chulae TaxID=88201 RepID=A0AAW0NEX1_9GOBI
MHFWACAIYTPERHIVRKIRYSFAKSKISRRTGNGTEKIKHRPASLHKERTKAANLQTLLNKKDHETRLEKEALESLVAKLTTELDQEKREKEQRQNRVKELEKQQDAFRETIQKCYAAYQGSAAKGNQIH